MESFVLWCGFLGAWLLVAGPVHQAALELREQEFHEAEIEAVATQVPRPARPSRWWWLLPPVAYALNRRRTAEYQLAVLRQLPAELTRGLTSYVNKAVGWLLVAGGALLIAIKETWELGEHYHWPTAFYWAVVAVMLVIGTAGTITGQLRRERRVAAQ